MNTSNSSSPVRTQAFTLIELLTVIAIIGILASILIPVVGRVRESARATVCMSNIRQVTLGMLLFANDNDGVLPTSGGLEEGENAATDWILWRRNDRDIAQSAIVPHLGGSFSPDIYRCPSDDTATTRQPPQYRFSYSLNRALGESHPRWAFAQINGRIELVADPTRVILMVEEATPNDSSAVLNADPLSERHGGRGHASFVDGHVKAVYPEFAAWRPHWDPFFTSPRPYEGRR
jgi:prepilin-type N-terminal cleavage/methylation domain-containing protein/prepilin-type processing-associated H-X9-DG protein